METFIDVILIISALVLSYVAFITISYAVAKMLFPKIEIDDDEIVDFERIKKFRSRLERRRGDYAVKQG